MSPEERFLTQDEHTRYVINVVDLIDNFNHREPKNVHSFLLLLFTFTKENKIDFLKLAEEFGIEEQERLVELVKARNMQLFTMMATRLAKISN